MDRLPAPRYVIITPARDEGEYIEKTIHSVLSQTIKPVRWIVVNDGSNDDTGKIIDEYVRGYSWIKAVHRKNRGFRKAGGGVIEAFYDGYNLIDFKDWEFIIKLDGDLSFDADYFQKCFGYFEENPKLGIGGGAIYNKVNGGLELEKTPVFHVRGATKIYRRECWEAIRGLIEAPGWDTVDEVKANMLGWQTQTFPDIKVVQLKPTGEADGTWRDLTKHGRANYIAGYHPLFMAVKCLKRLGQKPYLMGSVALLYGFISGYTEKIPQIEDRALIEYLRKQQLRRLVFKPTIWK